MAEIEWRGVGLAVCMAASVVAVGSCSGSADAKQCVSSAEAKVCAWRDGAVRVSTEGLEPGSAFRSVATTSGFDPVETSPDLEVGEDGTIPGAIGIMSPAGGQVTLDITAVAAGGTPLTGRLVID